MATELEGGGDKATKKGLFLQLLLGDLGAPSGDFGAPLGDSGAPSGNFGAPSGDFGSPRRSRIRKVNF